MNKKQVIAIIGAILLFVGVFAPIVSVPILGSLNYFRNGEGDGVIVLALAVASVALALAKLYKGLWLTGGGSLCVLGVTFFNFQSKMSELRSSMKHDLAGNPFAGLGQAALGSVELQWGWALLVIGACLVMTAAIVREDDTEAQGAEKDERKCPFCAEVIRTEAKICRFCKSDLTPLPPSGLAQSGETPVPQPTPAPNERINLQPELSTGNVADIADEHFANTGITVPAPTDASFPVSTPPNSSNSTKESHETQESSKPVIIGFCIVAAFIVLMIIGVIVDRSGAKSESSTTTEAKPVVDEITLHPYDLLRNPYSHKNHIVTLNAEEWPMLYNGQVLRYLDGGSVRVGLGYSGLRFKKMLDEHTAVYDIMGMDAQGSSDLEMLGQLAVQGSPGGELDVTRMWDVEPLGSLEGSNALGGTVTVPAVRLWGYTDQRNATQQERPATAPATPTAVQQNFQYAEYPNGYLVDEFCASLNGKFCYPFGWKPWLKELEQRTAGAYADVIARDSDTQSPGNSVISWDDQQRVVFGGSRPHSGDDGIVYFIVAPRTKEMDIIWKSESGVKYLGPHAALLQSNSAYEWLWGQQQQALAADAQRYLHTKAQ